MSHGLEQAGLNIVAGVDYDEETVDTYRKNHVSQGIVEDLSDLKPYEFAEKYDIYPNDIQVIGGGPPCQGFSNANQNTGDDERNDLIFTYADYVEYFDPEFFVMENVVGILSYGRYEQFIKYLERIGYDVNYEKINTAECGVPQKRKRVITIGRRDGPSDIIFERMQPVEDHVTVREAIDDLPVLKAGESSDINAHQAVNHRSDSLERIELVHEGGDMRHIPEEYQLKSYDTQRHACCYGRLRWDEAADTITTGFTRPGSGRFIHPSQNRALTPREAARIQSFPDSFVFSKKMSQSAKEIGNAVPPLLAEKIGRQIMMENALTETFGESVVADD